MFRIPYPTCPFFLRQNRAPGRNASTCVQSFREVAILPEIPAGTGGKIMSKDPAAGSAVKTASMLNVDNRIMYRIGVVAKKMGLCEDEVVVGIPLSVSGKSIYFDRGR